VTLQKLEKSCIYRYVTIASEKECVIVAREWVR
jgi:hypothetical protein